MFRGREQGYTLHSPVSPSLPLPCVTVYHQVSIELYIQTTLKSGMKIALYMSPEMQLEIQLIRLIN